MSASAAGGGADGEAEDGGESFVFRPEPATAGGDVPRELET